ncbi:hypothetical protein EWM64_g9236, partial [Hericium alpestre]
MRLFPPPPPDQYSSALKPGNTSVYFHRQEHAFFAQAGKEIVRVRVEADFMRTDKGKEPAVPRAWPAVTGPPHT